jgi:hypothetical protein
MSAAAAALPAPAARARRGVAVVFVALMLAVLLAALDATIVATALPTITEELGGLNQLSWVVTGYLRPRRSPRRSTASSATSMGANASSRRRSGSSWQGRRCAG